MNKYYFLLCSLPTINIGSKPDISFVELENYLDWNLSETDKKVLYDFKQYIDIKNLKNIWMGNHVDMRGNLDEKAISEASQTEDYFPSFVFEYLKKYESKDDRILNFASLENQFLKYQIENAKSNFIRSYFAFERDTKMVLAALRAKKLGVDLIKEIAIEDSKDPIVETIFSQKDEREYHPPKGFEKLKGVFDKNQNAPTALNTAFIEYCFYSYFELTEGDLFNIDQILGYLANLILVEDYYNLDHDQGKSIVDSMLIGK